MPTDFSKLGNAIQVTVDSGQPKAYVGVPVSYSFNSAGTILNITFGTSGSYSVNLTDLRIAGAGSAPANAAAAYTALSAVMGIYP